MLAAATKTINVSIIAYIRTNQNSLGTFRFEYNNGLQLSASTKDIFQYVTENMQVAEKYVSALVEVKIAKIVSILAVTYVASKQFLFLIMNSSTFYPINMKLEIMMQIRTVQSELQEYVLRNLYSIQISAIERADALTIPTAKSTTFRTSDSYSIMFSTSCI